MHTYQSNLLTDLPEYVQQDVLLPWSAALQVMEPVIQKQHPMHKEALALFKAYIAEMDSELSVRQMAWSWEHFYGGFVEQIPVRVNQWIKSKGKTKSPIGLLGDLHRIQKALFLDPVKNRLQGSTQGKVALKALFGLGYALDFVFLLLAFNIIGSGLVGLKSYF